MKNEDFDVMSQEKSEEENLDSEDIDDANSDFDFWYIHLIFNYSK